MITKPKGCYDLTGKEAEIYNQIAHVFEAYAKTYNYKYIRTPVLKVQSF